MLSFRGVLRLKGSGAEAPNALRLMVDAEFQLISKINCIECDQPEHGTEWHPETHRISRVVS